ncbi:nucleoside deaminase [Alcaligenes sp. SDU_A2]|uniref:nucleoside deaminase n=1 Tax=Alcaligenes sp. SDU_A2 TaxID=3136634 RepID=UPI003120223A
MMADDPAPYLVQSMQEAVAYSAEHVHGGGIPFAAFVVDAHGTVLGRGVNRVRELLDPTAHAEVQAIRDACRTVGAPNLGGLTLVASGEPCAMCYLSALYAGIGRVYFAVDRNEAAAHGFDYRGTYSLFSRDPQHWPSLLARKLPVPQGLQPFLAFSSHVQAPRSGGS